MGLTPRRSAKGHGKIIVSNIIWTKTALAWSLDSFQTLGEYGRVAAQFAIFRVKSLFYTGILVELA
jgi:hypothetical protein